MRIRFEVSLESSGEIDFKALTKTLQPPPREENDALEEKQDAEEDPNVVDLTDDNPVASTIRAPPVPEPSSPPPTLFQSKKGFNIIEHLEQRYGKGGFLDIKGKPPPRKNVDYDDLYDSEDSFIDDSDLHESIENTYFQSQVKTKHSGFFVNAGESIETIRDTDKAADLSAEAYDSENESPKKKGKKYIHEDMYTEDDWQPGPDVEAVLTKFKQEATEYFAQNAASKVWPPALDDGLREVDKLVVAAHPQGWRVNGYMAHLMSFLPYTKTTLRTRMTMLEARDNASDAKQKVEEHVVAFQSNMAPYGVKLESTESSAEQTKEAVMADSQVANLIYMALTMLDEWVVKENEYRPLLKQDDKKLLEEADTVLLSTQKERNRLYNKLLASMPAKLHGLIDVAALRELFKIGRKGSNYKPNTPHSTPMTKKAGSTTAKKPIKTPPVKAPKAKESPATTTDPAAPKAPPAKKAAKPLKSRRFETCPIWSPVDFQERKAS
ncbi:hypothetical protein AC1031_007026 [Aphanomyces cochlioides]|nr:hypothetical protein AC1031_007026 [Aphanomyces cochlioides]